MDFQALDDDEEDGAELFFEGPDADAIVGLALAETPIPAPVVPPPSRKKAAAKAKPALLPVPVDVEPPLAEPVDMASEAAPVIAAPASSGPAIPRPAIPRKVTIALILAAVASLFSAIGLIVTARNLAVLTERQHEAERRGAAFTRLPALLAEVEKLAAAQRTELARAAAAHPSSLVTSAELSHQLDGLRFVLAKSQPPGTTALASVVRQGQAELSHRIDQVNDRIDKSEGRRAAH